LKFSVSSGEGGLGTKPPIGEGEEGGRGGKRVSEQV